MAKLFRCRDTGVNCNAEMRGNDEQDLLQKVQEHARAVHKLELRSDNATMQKVRQAIRDV